MSITVWIQAISALIVLCGVIVSLYIGVNSIRLTRQVQMRRERNELLDRIEQWAVELSESGIEASPSGLMEDKDADKAWPYLGQQLQQLVKLQLLRARSIAILNISRKIDKKLNNLVTNSVNALMEHLRLLYEYRDFEEKRDKTGAIRAGFLSSTAKAISHNHIVIYEVAVSVIEQVSEIRDI